ncbi:MAG: hypothetical protein ACXVZV_15835, partial [Terriglobales bacterium]
DYNAVQARVTGTCPSGTAVGTVKSDGSVTCNAATGGGPIALPYAGSGGDNPPTTQGTFKITDLTNGPPNVDPIDPNAIPTALLGRATGTGLVVGVAGKTTGADGVPIVGLSTAANADDVPVILAWSQATSGYLQLFSGMASSPSAIGLDLEFTATPASMIYGVDTSTGAAFIVDGGGSIMTSGSVNVAHDITAGGTITAPTKHFRIDHPLDPGNKWLYHTSVESPDMKDLYDGLVVLDKQGQAWVTMPDWFQALNRDFRYQLTAIGAPGPRLYIAQEISGNRFKIAGGKPGMKVSWLITGIRQDAWAADNRIPIEQQKVGAEIGKYYHPRNVHPANSDANAKLK